MKSFMKLSAVMAAVSPLVAAQTFSECNPMTNTSCTPNPALCSSFETDFTKGSMDGWKATAGSLNYVSDGAEFTISKRGEAPTIQTNAYLFFGYVEVVMKSAVGTGIISSIVLESDDLDEVDWEFLGGDNTNVQTNYFGKGNTTSFDRMIQYPVATPQNEFHTYAVNWTKDAMIWSIDGTAVRTLNFADAVGGKNFPQTPVNVRLGIWAGGDEDNNEGTISWAGGKTDYSKAPFTMTVKSVKIINDNPGKEYQWTDQTGSFQSIKTVEGDCTAAAASNSTGPGVFAPGSSNATESTFGHDGKGSGAETCSTMSTVTVTVTEGEGLPPTPTAGTTVVKATSVITNPPVTAVPSTAQYLTPSAVPSSIIMDTGSPSFPATTDLSPTGGSGLNATATASSPAAFTGAATKPLDSSRFAITSLVSILMGLLAL